ncbi:MAG TPA: oligopeptide:H+ symporter [Chlamydiales bacterium]|nr:oligopeptide:H+ symporter [Chlamydiales bacterium]
MRSKQPKGLYPLFFTELWERFGFYTVQTILVLYISKGLHYADGAAYLLYGAFSSMLYLTPVMGGYIADRYIGFRQAIAIGAILLIIGYAVMAIPNEQALFLGLTIVIIGNGFFKPNVSGIVGELYTPDDPRRDGGFTLFYMGINIGSLLPPIFIGALVAAYTWGSGFLLASLGMVISLITFLIYRKNLGDAGTVPGISSLHRQKAGFYLLLLVGIVIAAALFQLVLLYPRWGTLVLIIASLFVIAGVLFYLFKENPEQRKKLTACLILTLISVGFWALYNQTFTSLMLFADRNMTKDFLGFTIDAEFTQFFNPFFIILFSPLLSWLWVRLDEKGMNPSTPAKFGLGVLFMSLGFLFLSGGVLFFSQNGMSSPWWLVISYLIQTLGELFLSPIGLAMVTRLSPRHLVGMMMGVWFLTNSAAFAIGGELAALSDVPKDTPGAVSLEIYGHAFFIYGIISLILTLLSFALVPYLKKLIHGTSGPILTPKR